MSTHYLDIDLLKDPEFPAHQLLSALYSKLHRALAQSGAQTVAVSFPRYALKSLGDRLRLIASAAELEALMAGDWLRGMRDHIQLGAICPVPAIHEHRPLRRVQAKSSPERLRRRQMKRHGLTEDQAREQFPDSCAERLNLPFLLLASSSTGQSFRFYLRLGPAQAAASAGPFNSYGLSSSATVPHF